MKKTRMLTLLAGVCFAGSLSAAIVVNDILLINFTHSGDLVGGNWNEFVSGTGSNQAYFSADSEVEISTNLKRFSDGATTGVTLDVEIPVGSQWGIGGANNSNPGFSFPNSGAIDANAVKRLTYHSEDGGTDVSSSYIFRNLDDSLTYELSILSYVGAARNTNSWSVDGNNLNIDPSSATGVYTFSNLSTDGSGNLKLSVSGVNANPDIGHVNAMELTAIPEPGSLVLLGLAMVSLVALRRR